MHQDDSDLVERARQGDVDAYGELVRRHQDQALAAAYVILGDRQEAEDATQEAFTNAYLALERFRSGASFRAWLLRIVVNEAYDLRTARRRRGELLQRASGDPGLVGTEASAEAAALGQRRREVILAALFELPEADRLVVTCRYFLDLSEAETADVLGIARGTVKSRLSRALARLGPVLRDLGPLVVVPPMVDMSHAVAYPAGGSGVKGIIASGLSKLRSRAAHVSAIAAATVTALVVASSVMVTGGRSAPAGPVGSPGSARSMTVYGGDLTDTDRQQLATNFRTQAGPSETVSNQELVDTLTAQGVPVQGADEAISSVQVVCGGAAAGIEVLTDNITRLTPGEYAAALITSGLYEASVVVAAPAGKAVTGETALVGLFKASPSCSGGAAADPQRVRLAYQELKLVGDLAGSAEDFTQASAVFLDMFNAVLAGQARDAAGVENTLQSAAARNGLTLGDSTRSEALTLLGELSELDYGPYRRGLVVQQINEHDVRVIPAQ